MLDKTFAAAIAALPLGLVGVAVGRIFNTTIEGISRNPSVRDKVFFHCDVGVCRDRSHCFDSFAGRLIDFIQLIVDRGGLRHATI